MTVRRRATPTKINRAARASPSSAPRKRKEDGCAPDQSTTPQDAACHRIGWPTAEAARPGNGNVSTVGRPLIARRGTARDLC
jgi:hypothetical protein